MVNRAFKFNSHDKYVIYLSPLYRWGNWSLVRVSTLLHKRKSQNVNPCPTPPVYSMDISHFLPKQQARGKDFHLDLEAGGYSLKKPGHHRMYNAFICISSPKDLARLSWASSSFYTHSHDNDLAQSPGWAWAADKYVINSEHAASTAIQTHSLPTPKQVQP